MEKTAGKREHKRKHDKGPDWMTAAHALNGVR
jgi:hypothetical protein